MTRPLPQEDARLEIVLFSGDIVAFGRGELARGLLHRYVLIHYLFLCFFLSIVDTSSGQPIAMMEERAIIIASGVVVAVVVLLLVALVLDQIAARRGRFCISASPFLFTAAAIGVFVGDVAELWIVENSTQLWLRSGALALFYYILAEAVAHLLMLVVMPRVLRDLRGYVPSPVEPAVSVPPLAMFPVADAAVDQLEIGGRLVNAQDLIRITAEGNYLRVLTQQDRMYLPGPFGVVVDPLPEQLGVRVSRSDWVARSAVRGIRREGREMFVDLHDGATVRVANSRQKVVTSVLDLPVQRMRLSAKAQGGAKSIQSG